MKNTEELRQTIQELKEKFEPPYTAIENGGDFNGIVYARKVGNGRNFDMRVYVSNQIYSLGRMGKEYVQEVKDAFYLLLAEGFEGESVKPVRVKRGQESRPLATWTVDGKEIKNRLNWAEMYDEYGMDFE